MPADGGFASILPRPLWRAIARFGAERPITRYIPQYSHLTRHIVRHVNGTVEAMFSVQGASWECLDKGELASQHERMCELERTLNLRSRLNSSRYLVHTEATPDDCPAFTLPTPFIAAMDAQYRHRLVGQGRLYRNHLYYAVTIRPPALTKRRKRTADAVALQPVDPVDVEALKNVCNTILTDLGSDYGLKLLGTRDEHGRLFSEIAEAHAFILTGRKRKVPIPRGRLGYAICPHRPVFRDNRVVELRHTGLIEVAALFGFSSPPPATDADMFDPLLALEARFSLSQHMGTLKLHESQNLVSRKTNQMVSANDPAAKQKHELTTAASELQQREYGMGPHNLTLAVFADNDHALDAAAEKGSDALRGCGAIIARLDWDLEAAYFGVLPGNGGLHPRAAAIKTRNFAAMAPLHGYPTGWREGEWCDHVAVLNTNGGTAFYWNPHTSEAGGPGKVPHMLWTGPTRSGKTTAMLWLLARLMDLAGAQVVLWDKDRGAKLFVRRLNGTYIEFRIGVDSGLAPLKALDGNNPEDMDHLGQLVLALIASDGGPKLKPEQERRIGLALRTVMAMPVELRSLGEVAAFLGAGPESPSARLRRWCRGEPLGWVIDNERDRISLDAQLVAFDQTKYLDHPLACGPIQSELFYRVGKLTDGRRLMVAIDEFQKSLQNEAFEGLIGNGLATFGKLNVAMWLATQSIATALRAKNIAHTIREQCLNQAHFPNGSAKWSEYDAIGVPPMAFSWIKSGLSGGGKGRFMLRQGNDFTPVQLSLEGMDDTLAVISGQEHNVRLFEETEAEHPHADTDELFRIFHIRRKLPSFLARTSQAAQPETEAVELSP